MKTGRTALQLVRVVMLVALLLATGWFGNPSAPPQSLGELWAPWAATSLITVAFVAIMLAARRHRHPWAVLAVEAVIATTLAFVPPTLWILWFGLYDWTLALLSGYATPLAVAWLGVVVASGLCQLKGARATIPRLASEDADVPT